MDGELQVRKLSEPRRDMQKNMTPIQTENHKKKTKMLLLNDLVLLITSQLLYIWIIFMKYFWVHKIAFVPVWFDFPHSPEMDCSWIIIISGVISLKQTVRRNANWWMTSTNYFWVKRFFPRMLPGEIHSNWWRHRDEDLGGIIVVLWDGGWKSAGRKMKC